MLPSGNSGRKPRSHLTLCGPIRRLRSSIAIGYRSEKRPSKNHSKNSRSTWVYCSVPSSLSAPNTPITDGGIGILRIGSKPNRSIRCYRPSKHTSAHIATSTTSFTTGDRTQHSLVCQEPRRHGIRSRKVALEHRTPRPNFLPLARVHP